MDPAPSLTKVGGVPKLAHGLLPSLSTPVNSKICEQNHLSTLKIRLFDR